LIYLIKNRKDEEKLSKQNNIAKEFKKSSNLYKLMKKKMINEEKIKKQTFLDWKLAYLSFKVGSLLKNKTEQPNHFSNFELSYNHISTKKPISLEVKEKNRSAKRF